MAAMSDAERQRKRRQKLKEHSEYEQYRPEVFIAEAVRTLSAELPIDKIVETAHEIAKDRFAGYSTIHIKYAQKEISNYIKGE